MRISFLPGKERALQMIRASGRAIVRLPRTLFRRSAAGGDRGTDAGDFPRAVRSRARAALPRGDAAARRRRPRAGVLDPSRHRRRLDAGRLRAGSVRGLRDGAVRLPQSSRRGSDGLSNTLPPVPLKPTAHGAPPSARSGSRRSWSRERLFGNRSSRAIADSGAPSRGRTPPRARISA